MKMLFLAATNGVKIRPKDFREFENCHQPEEEKGGFHVLNEDQRAET